MRTTTTTAWTAALAIMSMRGPLTTAEAAPARQYDAERQRHYFPKHLRRGGYNHTSPAIESSSNLPLEPGFRSVDSSSSQPPITPDTSLPPTNTRRTRSSTQSSQAYDEDALIESLIEAGRLPETTNAVVTTTLTLAYNDQRTATYTLTYTETSSPVPSEHPKVAKSKPPVPLLTSASVPAPVGTAPGSHHKPKHGHEKATTSAKDTSTRHNPLASLVPSIPLPLSSSHRRIDSRTYHHHNATNLVQPAPSSSAPLSSSSAPPSSSDAAGLLGLTNSLLGQGTKHAGTKKPHKTPKPTDSAETVPTQSSEGLLGHLLPTDTSQPLPIPKVLGTNGLLHSTDGLVPLNQPKPTPASSSSAYSASASPSSDGGILLGLSSAIPNILGTDRHSPDSQPTKSNDNGLLGTLGITGLPTGVSLPAQSVLPTGILPGGRKKPGDSLTNLVGSATGLVGTLTDGVDTAVSHATGLVGTLASGVDTAMSHATGLVGTLASGVDTAVSHATGLVGTLNSGVDTVVSHATGLVGTVTDGVNSITSAVPTDLSGVVGTATGLVGTATGLMGTLTSDATDLTGLVGTATGLVGTATGLVGTATGLVGTATDTINSLTGTLGASVPTGGYTITGGGVTLTVPIPTSVPSSIPITMPSQLSNTGTGPTGYSITVPTGASSILSSLSSAVPTDYSETVPDSASSDSPSTYSASIPLTGSTKATLTHSGTGPSSYSTKQTSAVPAASSSSVAPETLTSHHTQTQSQAPAPATIKPTGTNTQTSLTFPTSWHFAPTTWATKTSGLSTATSGSGTDTADTGLPTYMPRLVQPPGGMPNPPGNMTLIQLGFFFGLNYPFVVGEPESAGQIFNYLPQGIAYGLGISRELVTMNALMPYDTSNRLKYITTLAQAYIPSQLVDTMEMSIHMPLSQIYSNPDAPIKTLMGMINPTIPILPGAVWGESSSSAWYNPAATATTGPGAGAPLGGDSGSSNHVKPSTVGIGIGAVGGAAVYAAAMVYVARRYKQKRQGHQRASSVHTSGQMSQRSGGMAGFFMSGANGIGSGSGGRGSRTSAGSSNGRSVREQGISGPIMAENSLGWN